MTQEDALAVWDSWISNYQFVANRTKPDRDMLDALIGCDRVAPPGFLESLNLPHRWTIGQVAEALIQRYYS